MFVVGLILLIAGACLVYGTTFITRLVPREGKKHELKIKVIGLTCGVVGALILFRSEIPGYLKWIRVLEKIRFF